MMSVLSVRSTDADEVTAAHLAASKGHAGVLRSILHSSNIKTRENVENCTSFCSNRNTRHGNENISKNGKNGNNGNNENNENDEKNEKNESNESKEYKQKTTAVKNRDLRLVSGRELASVRNAMDWLPLHSLAQGEDPFNEVGEI